MGYNEKTPKPYWYYRWRPLIFFSLLIFSDWSTLQRSEHQNDKTQEQFLSPSNPSHEHLTILNMEHTTLLYNYLFTTNLPSFLIVYIFFILNLHSSDLTHNCLYCILYFCHFVYCLFVNLYIVLLLSVSCCCHSVALWSFCHYNKFIVCVNIAGQ